MEDHHVINTVQELWSEVLLQLILHLELHALVLRVLPVGSGAGEAHAHGLGDVRGAQVGGEDQYGVLEVHFASLAIGQATFFQDLQQGVVDLLVGLLDLVEQHHGERLAAHLFGELAALVVADVSRRGTEQAGCGEAIVELAHVDLDQRIVLAEEELGKSLGQLGLTHTGWTGEDEGAGRTLWILQTRAGAADGARDSLDCIVLADDPLVQLIFHAQQACGFFLGEAEHGDTGPVAQHLGDLLFAHLGYVIQLACTPCLFLLGTLFGELALVLAQGCCLFRSPAHQWQFPSGGEPR